MHRVAAMDEAMKEEEAMTKLKSAMEQVTFFLGSNVLRIERGCGLVCNGFDFDRAQVYTYMQIEGLEVAMGPWVTVGRDFRQ